MMNIMNISKNKNKKRLSISMSKEDNDLSEGTRGWNFHWSSSWSKVSLFMILFFSSGGIKFSIIRYLHKHNTHTNIFKDGSEGPKLQAANLTFHLFLYFYQKLFFAFPDIKEGTKKSNILVFVNMYWEFCTVLHHTVIQLYSRLTLVNQLRLVKPLSATRPWAHEQAGIDKGWMEIWIWKFC